MKLSQWLIFVMLIAFNQILAQEVKESKGFIGLSAGPSFWINAPEHSKPGLNLCLVNFGYTFGKGFGMSVRWMGGAHIYNYSTLVSGSQTQYHHEREFSCGALMVGPMYSIRISKAIVLDIKLVAGTFYEKFKASGSWDDGLNSSQYNSQSENYSYCYSIGSSLRHNFSKRWSWSLQLDVNSGRNNIYFDYDSGSFSTNPNPAPPAIPKYPNFVTTVNMNIGIQVRV